MLFGVTHSTFTLLPSLAPAAHCVTDSRLCKEL
jgi:hypothetical protein